MSSTSRGRQSRRVPAPPEVSAAFSVVSTSSARTRELGRALGARAAASDIYLLQGDLGTGKTTFTQGIAEGLGVRSPVRSPSFVLVHEHRGTALSLYHIDLYRLERLPEVADLGLEEYFSGDAVSVIEWAERAAELLPAEHLLIRFEHVSARQRRLSFQPQGERYRRLVTDLQQTAAAR